MTIIPFPPNTPGKDETTRTSLLATYYTLEEQIELLDEQIRTKEKKLQTLAIGETAKPFGNIRKKQIC